MNRLIWSAAALGAIVFLAALALTGGRGGPGLQPFVPKGLMMIRLEDVREVELETREGRWHFVRAEDGWHAAAGETTAGFAARLDGALRLLRNSGPERVLSSTETAGVDPAQFGLDPPRLRVVVNGSGASSFVISFGATNVLGLSHYARREGSGEIAMLPGFVAEEWERVGKMP
ncbi:hypothetical protein CI1B_36640 [Bradyrhizobium ivorense]|uniref:DUF4340 domain-containing protein n=1 Tax=Bradyrhizobium ivorense TaxID=2511166 RepID=A0A508TB57_9BRAD|nr:hypothetical protein [Bradyrhizobium ivorense]VIO71480.1 hypothetical protein CI1B_36640 [Bradyrhizobium ivorense]